MKYGVLSRKSAWFVAGSAALCASLPAHQTASAQDRPGYGSAYDQQAYAQQQYAQQGYGQLPPGARGGQLPPAYAAAAASAARQGMAAIAPGGAGSLEQVQAIETQIATALVRSESATQQEESANAQIESLREEKTHANERLTTRVRALYRLSRMPGVPLAAGFDSFLRHVARVFRLKKLVERDIDASSTIARRLDEVRSLAVRSHEANVLARAEVSMLEERKDATLAQAEADLSYDAAFGMPMPGMAGMTTMPPLGEYGMDPLGAMPNRRALMAFGPTEPTAGSSGSVSSEGGTIRVLDDDGATVGYGPVFESLRGDLPLPASGDVQLVDRESNGGPGLQVRTRMGGAVRAIAAGRVVFAGEQSAYGRVVIVDHGQRYYTVYAGLGTVEVRPGDELSRSARVGSTGADGVLLEIRKGTRSVPPRPWLGL